VKPIEIRSYRRVFDLERRIYRVDRLRLNPAGVPVRALLYGLGLCVCALVVVRVPLVGSLLRLVPWLVRDLLAPIGGAGLLTMIRVEGRPFHLAARTLLRYVIGPCRLTGLCQAARTGKHWHPPTIVMLPDGSDGRLRRLRCHGPGVVLVGPAHERVERELGLLARLGRRPRLTLTELTEHRAPAQAQTIELAPSTSLRVLI
jgi:hypothetical protein